MEDRRRSPRYQVASGEMALVPSAVSVQILDISRGGVLLRSTHGVRLASTGKLTTMLKGQPFTAEVEVRRVEPVQGGGCRIGARFIGISTEHKRVLEDFTFRPSS